MVFRVILITFLFSGSIVYGQKSKTHVLTADEAKSVKKDAATFFSSENYSSALKGYLDLYKVDSTNVDYNYKLGFCYLMTNVNKKAALPYIKFAVQSDDSKKEWLYSLGLAHMYHENWDEAIEAFTDFITAHTKIDKEAIPPARMLEMCENGRDLSLNPVNCKFTNLGKTINSPYEEYNPFISADNGTLLFTARKKGNMGGFIEDLGIYTADIYSAFWNDTLWTKPRSVGANVNSEWDEELVGLSASGDQAIIYFDNAEYYGDIGTSSLKGKTWLKPEMFPEIINSKQIESGATLSLDGNTIYFSNDGKESIGKYDIWMAKKVNGIWEAPINVKELNSTYDEINPMLSFDGKILYFSSDGWNSMGGYDIFFSTFDDISGVWSKPKNLGFPLNNADDNMNISFSGDGKYAYLSASRSDGFGDRDIYQVEFTDTLHHPFSNIISGTISKNSSRIEIIKIILEDETGKQLISSPTPYAKKFSLPAKPGDYTLRIEGYNFEPYSEKVSVGNEFPPEKIEKSIQLLLAK